MSSMKSTTFTNDYDAARANMERRVAEADKMRMASISALQGALKLRESHYRLVAAAKEVVYHRAYPPAMDSAMDALEDAITDAERFM
jgi:hypothetical protein